MDYALLIHRTPRLFIEAKDLSASLGDRKWIAQVVKYATVAGVKWCVLTNGDEYCLYNAHASVDVEKKLFRTVRISDVSQDSYTCETLDLLSKEKMAQDLIGEYWREHFADRTVEAALYDLLQNDDPSLIRLIRRKAPDLTRSEIRDSLDRANIRIDFPAISLPSPLERVSHESVQTSTTVESELSAETVKVDMGDIIRAGLIQVPAQLEKEYRGVKLVAQLQTDGEIRFDGKVYDSASISASMARKSVVGAPSGKPYPNTNGWGFLEVS